MRIAMWSGPRNLSTAMMYAFAARGDFGVVDEPFYAAYLLASGADHPMRAEVLASQPQRAAQVISALPTGAPHAYAKLMTHHMVPAMPLEWAGDWVNVHLIRHPARVLASYTAKRQTVTSDDIGVARQAEIFAQLPGPVIDSADIRADPEAMLRRLCAEIGLPWRPQMLHWPEGPKPYDGVWARHWYGAVHASRGFAGPEGPLPDLPDTLRPLLADALPAYSAMADRRLGA